jgi:hypothetical protein
MLVKRPKPTIISARLLKRNKVYRKPYYKVLELASRLKYYFQSLKIFIKLQVF